jgi:hypothetical protein
MMRTSHFLMNDDDVSFVLDQQLDFYSANWLKQQSTDRHVSPHSHIILTVSPHSHIILTVSPHSHIILTVSPLMVCTWWRSNIYLYDSLCGDPTGEQSKDQ